MTINDINNLPIDTIVIDGVNGGYAKVKRCLHGNKYYAISSWCDIVDDIPASLNYEDLPIAYDTDIDYITCCR